MQKLFCFVALVLYLSCSSCFAHDGYSQQLRDPVEIKASPKQVWKLIREFGAPHVWMPMVKSTHATGDNVPGATRVLSLVNGGTITEVLKRLNDEKMFMI